MTQTGEKFRKRKRLKNIFVSNVAQEWLQCVKSSYKYSTYVKYQSVYEKHIRDFIGEYRIGDIEEEDFLGILEHEIIKNNGMPLSSSMMNSIQNVFSQIMLYGNHPVQITYNPYKGSRHTGCKEHTLSVFTKAEQYKLRQYLSSHMNGYNLGIMICLFTGMRLGEICALRTRDIDLENRTIHVAQTVQRIRSPKEETKTELLVSNPKTLHSCRFIPICDFLWDILQENMGEQIYLIKQDVPAEPRTYQYWFERILNQLNIRKLNFHSLRHTFATNCIESGMDPKCLSEILGHADVKTTLNRYVHPSFEQKIRQLNRVSTDYSQVNGQVS